VGLARIRCIYGGTTGIINCVARVLIGGVACVSVCDTSGWATHSLTSSETWNHICLFFILFHGCAKSLEVT
jgi:hypothetical protein